MDWQLGDERLDIRGDICLDGLLMAPKESFPNIFPDASDQVGFYRFINNDRFDYKDLMSAVEADTFEKAHDQIVLAIHDTTQVKLGDKGNSIDEFRVKPGQTKAGFFAHVSLLANASSNEVIGPCGLTIWSRGMGVKEAPRWLKHVFHVESERKTHQTIHLMDREGDSYEIAAQLQSNCRFVIRLSQDRLVSEASARRLFQFMENQEIVCDREVPLSKRQNPPYLRKAQIHPDRESRIAKLSISAARVTFKRGDRAPKYLPKTLTVNVIRVFEKHPPKGEKPTEWFLVTSEPIETPEQIEQVVDYYRKRWLIEEFFKALKSGCRLEERLLESAAAWKKVFVLFLPVAKNLLNLRILSGNKNNSIFSEEQLTVLKHQAKRFKIKLRTIDDAKMVIARLGGYHPGRWPPGWIVLGRGYEKIRAFAHGATI